MTRARAMILTSVWRDADFVALTPTAKLTYLALLSQPDLTHLGLLPVVYSRWARSLTLTLEAVREAVQELATARFVVLDEDAGQVLIRSFMRNDGVFRQPQILAAAASSVPLVASTAIAVAILAEVDRASAGADGSERVSALLVEMGTALKDLVATLPEAFGEPSGSLPEGFGQPSGSLPEGFGQPSGSLPEGCPQPLGDRGKELGVTTEVAVSRARTPARARGTRLPDPFVVTPEMVAWVRERVPAVDGRLETEKFVNYWRAKTGAGATKLDWVATWRNWMLSAAERLPNRQGAPVSSRSTTDDRVRQALDVGRELQARADRGELES